MEKRSRQHPDSQRTGIVVSLVFSLNGEHKYVHGLYILHEYVHKYIHLTHVECDIIKHSKTNNKQREWRERESNSAMANEHSNS